ncbi:hypothetical protein GYMLUDRAFT_36709 [Collybiopsis luxurians FD-317 M1]|nr:hypothetical protein GYMLUDRAFT_36709 [Collybiopsis luxurians FD-317 M1]
MARISTPWDINTNGSSCYSCPDDNMGDKSSHKCDHFDSHFLVRCGCPNDKPPSHPMHSMDDAFHREWCAKCLIFCYQPPHCKYVYRSKRRTIHPALFATILEFIARILRPFRSCI